MLGCHLYSFECILRCEIAGSCSNPVLNFSGTAKLFFTVAELFFPYQEIRNPIFSMVLKLGNCLRRNELTYYCGFNLFPNELMMLSI